MLADILYKNTTDINLYAMLKASGCIYCKTVYIVEM